MNGTEVEPGECGWDVPVPQQSAGTPENKKQPLTGPQGLPEENIEKTLDRTDNTAKPWQRQAYPIRWLKQRYWVLQNFAAFLAAEFHSGEAS
jgi:hypothetical protein